MPFEVFNVDISVPENRDDFLESYAFLKLHGSDNSEAFDVPGMFDTWIEHYPEEAKDFLRFCSEHEEPEVRHFAGVLAVDFFESDPDFAIDVIEARLLDDDPKVKESIAGYIFDTLREMSDCRNIVDVIGLNRTAWLIRAYKAATATSDN